MRMLTLPYSSLELIGVVEVVRRRSKVKRSTQRDWFARLVERRSFLSLDTFALEQEETIMHRLPSDMPAGRAEHHLLLDAAVRAGLASTSEELDLRGERLTNTATSARFIAKIGGPQVYGEALGLERMQRACPGIAPKLRALEQLDDPTGDGRTPFISDYEELGSASGDTRNKLAERLARELHNPDNPAYKDIVRFGFGVTTQCVYRRDRHRATSMRQTSLMHIHECI